MENLNEKYEKMIIEEDNFSKQLNTTELCLTAIIHYMFRYGDLADKISVENILAAVYQIEIGLRKDILKLRLEKALVACELKKNHQDITDSTSL